MITGVVTQSLEPVVDIALRTVDGVLFPVEAVIDTGFSGQLAAPEYILQQVGEPDDGLTELRTADDSRIQLTRYRVTINWFGDDREVKAYATGDEVLIGMRLLNGCRLVVNVAPEGAVELYQS